jgi:hypothetical protein
VLLRELARHFALLAALLLAAAVGSLPGVAAASTEPAPRAIILAAAEPPEPETAPLASPFADPSPEGPISLASTAPIDPAEAAPPAPLPSALEGDQVISFYGYPGVAVMGELGAHDPIEAAVRVRQLAAEYDALNGDRGAVGALHLIVDVAQARPTADGLYLDKLDKQAIAEYVEVARDYEILLFLDLQIGWSDPLEDARRLEWFLREPFVHLALDPEFATGRYGAAPGTVIGGLDAGQVNAVQAFLAELVRDQGIPPKLLVLHQFKPSMLIEPERFDAIDEVEITIDMDGFGGAGAKISGFQAYALAPYAERAAFKLFYHWDEPLLTPEQILAIGHRPPDYVIYQ